MYPFFANDCVLLAETQTHMNLNFTIEHNNEHATCFSSSRCKRFLFLYFTGVFLLPYCVLALLSGVPLFLMENALGQFTQEGTINCWKKLCPLLEGTLNCQRFSHETSKKQVSQGQVKVEAERWQFRLMERPIHENISLM